MKTKLYILKFLALLACIGLSSCLDREYQYMKLKHAPAQPSFYDVGFMATERAPFRDDGILFEILFNTHGYDYSMPYKATIRLLSFSPEKSLYISKLVILGESWEREYLINQHFKLDEITRRSFGPGNVKPLHSKTINILEDITVRELDKLAEDNGGFLTLNVDYILNDKKNTMTFKIDRVTGTYNPSNW